MGEGKRSNAARHQPLTAIPVRIARTYTDAAMKSHVYSTQYP
jgi:hypothetical protein